MILYVNGDSHSAGAEAIYPECSVCDNDKYHPSYVDEHFYFWNNEKIFAPYPDNLEVSYGKLLANKLGAKLHCHARAAGSNDRIIRTTYEYLSDYRPDFILIGWSTWEREEWYNDEDNQWYQVNGSGVDIVPEKWTDRYKQFVIKVDWNEKIKEAHEKIWNFHKDLNTRNIPHLFFNCQLTFNDLLYGKKDWGTNYLWPYSPDLSYGKYLESQGCKHNKWYHFDADAHKKWADFLYPHLTALL